VFWVGFLWAVDPMCALTGCLDVLRFEMTLDELANVVKQLNDVTSCIMRYSS
jgi:hypothetical protein